MYFPVFVTLAWIADRHRLLFKCLHKCYHTKRHGISEEMEVELEPEDIDVIMDEKLPDGSMCLGNSRSGTVSAQTGNKEDQSKDGVSCIKMQEMSSLST